MNQIPILETPSVACTLRGADYQARLRDIRELNRDGLRSHDRDDLALLLVYSRESAERVRELVAREQQCCAFLNFRIEEYPTEVRLTVTSPERAREAAQHLFDEFLSADGPHGKPRATRLAITATGTAVLCGICCVLPFALPAVALASVGGLLAWFAKAHWWVTILATLACGGAWLWIARTSARTGKRPAGATFVAMGVATALLLLAVVWPSIEPSVIALVRSR